MATVSGVCGLRDWKLYTRSDRVNACKTTLEPTCAPEIFEGVFLQTEGDWRGLPTSWRVSAC
jgi:hypothetical protein